MTHNDRIEIGKATGLHYATTRRARGPKRQARRGPSRGKGPSHLPVALVAVALVAGIALFAIWYSTARQVDITVNGETVQVREGSSISELLAAHDNFGATPGRLLSVSGNVLDEAGGDPCRVVRGGEEIPAADFATTSLDEGQELAVSDGADVEEASHEKTAEIAPGISMQRGGAVQYVSQWGASGSKTVKVGEVSGECVDVAVIEPQTDMVVSSVNLKPAGGRYVALTFDDGPSSYTPQILDILKQKGARATFFCLGAQVQKDPEGCRALVDAGQEVASHTMAHQNLPKLDRDSLRSEISSAFEAISSATGADTMMIRAPYGAFTDVEWGRSADIVACNVLWNIDTLDWQRPGAAAIKSAVLDGARNGSIILMHDGGGNRSQDVEALPGIIDGLRSRGFELVTVSELMRLDGTIPESVIAGTVTLPEGSALPGV